MASPHPTHGARVALERQDVGEHEVHYRVTIYEPETLHVGEARLARGEVHFGAWNGAPPAWAVTFAQRLLAGLAKKHAADRHWPRKLVRWREERS